MPRRLLAKPEAPSATPEAAPLLLVDISNSFTKLCLATPSRLLKPILRVPTAELRAGHVRIWGARRRRVVISSVVPDALARIQPALPPGTVLVTHRRAAGLKIRYPRPATIGADRLANAVAAIHLYGAPAIVVDFGTAVTFDVLDETGAYIGGVIAPGFAAMTDWLHERTALLPKITLRRPRRAVGRSTREAMRAGAIHGYRGLVQAILDQILREEFPQTRPRILATGGDARFLAKEIGLFDAAVPALTLEGLRLIGKTAASNSPLP